MVIAWYPSEESNMRTPVAPVIAVAAILAGFTAAAQADGHWRAEHGDRRDIGRFHERDIHRWAAGHWYRGYHDGRLAWWWVVGGAPESALWYAYTAPVYPYPDPYIPAQMNEPPAASAAPQVAHAVPPAVWYYCRASGKYYPYAATCRGGWQIVPATPGG